MWVEWQRQARFRKRTGKFKSIRPGCLVRSDEYISRLVQASLPPSSRAAFQRRVWGEFFGQRPLHRGDCPAGRHDGFGVGGYRSRQGSSYPGATRGHGRRSRGGMDRNGFSGRALPASLGKVTVPGVSLARRTHNHITSLPEEGGEDDQTC